MSHVRALYKTFTYISRGIKTNAQQSNFTKTKNGYNSAKFTDIDIN